MLDFLHLDKRDTPLAAGTLIELGEIGLLRNLEHRVSTNQAG